MRTVQEFKLVEAWVAPFLTSGFSFNADASLLLFVEESERMATGEKAGSGADAAASPLAKKRRTFGRLPAADQERPQDE